MLSPANHAFCKKIKRQYPRACDNHSEGLKLGFQGRALSIGVVHANDKGG